MNWRKQKKLWKKRNAPYAFDRRRGRLAKGKLNGSNRACYAVHGPRWHSMTRQMPCS